MAFARHRYAELKILIAAIVAQKEAGGTEGNKAEETASNNFLLELQTQIETVDAFVAKQKQTYRATFKKLQNNAGAHSLR